MWWHASVILAIRSWNMRLAMGIRFDASLGYVRFCLQDKELTVKWLRRERCLPWSRSLMA